MSWTGLARDLTRGPEPLILKARLAMRVREVERQGVGWLQVQAVRASRVMAERLLEKRVALRARYAELRAMFGHESRDAVRTLRADLRAMRRRAIRAYRRCMADFRRIEQPSPA